MSAMYAIFIGAVMLGQWAVALGSGGVPNLDSEPVGALVQLAVRLMSAVMLLIGGFGVWTNRSWGYRGFLVSMGMLMYSLLDSTTFYLQSGNLLLVWLLAVAAIVTVVLIAQAMRSREQTAFRE